MLHVGDRFTDSGNDVATRDICSVLWVANPEETGFFIKMLLKDIRKSRWGGMEGCVLGGEAKSEGGGAAREQGRSVCAGGGGQGLHGREDVAALPPCPPGQCPNPPAAIVPHPPARRWQPYIE